MRGEVRWQKVSLESMHQKATKRLVQVHVPTSQINPIAVDVMKEVGIDISSQKPKDLTEDMMRNATAIINMGCMDDKFCPTLFLPKVIDWGIEDPKDKPIEKVREIRDEIEKRVLEIIDSAKDNKIPI